MIKKTTQLFFLFSTSLLAQSVDVSNSKSLDITIYNNNLGFVKQNKSFTIKQEGEHLINYEGVPKSIIIDSVIPNFSNKSTILYSQNFEENNVNYQSLLEYYKQNNLDVNFYETTPNTNQKQLSKGKIISSFSNPMTIQKNNGTIHTVEISDIYFNSLPQSLQKIHPSLSWRVFSKEGKQDVDLMYLMNNITWNSNYTLDLEKQKANLKGWITIENNTGISFENANIFCLAGEVNKVTTPVARNQMLLKAQVAMDMQMHPEIKEESLSGYHLYTIPFKETISKGSKQINFIQKPEVSYEQIASLTTNIPTYALRDIQKLSFDNVIKINNTKNNNLGIALPAGIVRVFAKDENNAKHFIGENRIDHTANKEDIMIRIGKFFDIKAHIKQTNFSSKQGTFSNYLLSQIETKITNEDKVKRIIHLDQTHQGYGNYSLRSTCNGICKEEKINATKTRYIIELSPSQSYTFSTTYEQR